MRVARWLLVAAVVAALCVLIDRAAHTAQVERAWWWLEVHTGTVNESGPYYGFWSGFGSDLGEYALALSVFANLLHTVQRTGCQVGGPWPRGCWWPAMHDVEVAGVKHRVCHQHGGHPTLRHHPELGLHHEPGATLSSNPTE